MEADVEQVLIAEAVIDKRLDAMALEIRHDFPGEVMVVIVLLKGAFVFAADLLRRIPRMLEIECLNVASYHGGTESSGKVDFLDHKLPDIKGRKVLVLDDILDTGRTLRAVVDRLLEEGACEVKTGVLLRKDKELAEKVDADYIGFTIGDEFVIGYGLDYRGRYRNLPYIGTLKKEAI
jgi:hypoxanthine phosphoribosyltransferase